MSSEVAIRTEALGKQYLIRREQHRMRTLVETVGELISSPLERIRELRGEARRSERFWALRDVSFEIGEGELVGLVGPNGAGKSTLLRILSRITKPSAGAAEIHGSLRSLLDVGIGFHPELTGRENVYLNGAILGLSRAEIRSRFDEIIAFAEVERFVDTPVKRYSSGMYVRLAFAVAAHLEPDILLVDEVLSVGDAAFQRRGLDKIRQMARDGCTVVIVSHNLRTLRNLTTRALLLDKGTLVGDGRTAEILDRYLQSAEARAGTDLDARTDRSGNAKVRFSGVRVGTTGAESPGAVATGDHVTISLEVQAEGEARQVHLAVQIHGGLGEHLTTLSTVLTGSEIAVVDGRRTIRALIPRLPLAPGSYTLELIATVGGELADWIQNAGGMTVEPGRYFDAGIGEPAHGIGSVHLDHHWSLENE